MITRSRPRQTDTAPEKDYAQLEKPLDMNPERPPPLP